MTITPEDIEGYSAPGEVAVYTATIVNEGTVTLNSITLNSSEVRSNLFPV